MICKMASLFGRKEHILEGSSLISSRNLLELVRMAAAGLWVVMRNIENMEQPQLSILSRNVQNLWVGFLTHPDESVMIENSCIIFKTKHLKFFSTATLTQSGFNPTTKHMFASTFRTIMLPKLNLEFIVGAKLLLMRLDDISPPKIVTIVEYIFNKFRTLSVQLSIHSELSFIIKLFSTISILQSHNLKSDELFELALQ
jgi:hypothetical protein